MEFSKDDYIAWRENPVSCEFLTQAIVAMNDIMANLILNAGRDSLQDRFNSGTINGLKWLTEWQPDFEGKIDDESTDSGA